MSRIIIEDEDVDLSEWLEKHDVKIIVRRVVDNRWVAQFNKTLFVSGGVSQVAISRSDPTKVEAVYSLLRLLCGHTIGFNGPETIIVTGFKNVEVAVMEAEGLLALRRAGEEKRS